ncbi:uncharacterized protein LOC113389602 [Ctenocephalides felis]|uniref:uncharacterized protein LOC113389602 n=1 Tax=Ctenocephalides felis TaxID=7515 RepID=UPI000E6E5A6B|nr:uncharacterized protein LOC113389602 [Ctenocephalides felis]
MNNSLPSDTTSESPHHTTINITENPIIDATDGDDATTISARSIGTTSASPSGSPLHTATTAAPVARARRKSRTSLTDNHSNVDVHRGTSPDRLLRRSRRASFDMDSLHLQPLRETDIENKEPIPPLAGPEIWDTDKSDGSDSAPALPQPGVDDGFFTRTNGEEDEPGIDDGLLPPKPKDKDEHDDDDKHHYDPAHHHHNGVGSRRGSFPPFPYAPDFTPMTVNTK